MANWLDKELQMNGQAQYLERVLQGFKRLYAQQQLSTPAAKGRAQRRAERYARRNKVTVGGISNMANSVLLRALASHAPAVEIALKEGRQAMDADTARQKTKRIAARKALSTPAAQARAKKRAERYARNNEVTAGDASHMDQDYLQHELEVGLIAQQMERRHQRDVAQPIAREELSTPAAQARAKKRAEKGHRQQPAGPFDGSNVVERLVNNLWGAVASEFSGAQPTVGKVDLNDRWGGLQKSAGKGYLNDQAKNKAKASPKKQVTTKKAGAAAPGQTSAGSKTSYTKKDGTTVQVTAAQAEAYRKRRK